MSQAQRQNGGSHRVQREKQQALRGGVQPGEYSFSSTGAANLVQVLNESELPDDIRRLIEPELNQDHILGNLNREELRYRRFSLWNNKEIVLASFPPRESIWQGDVRKKASCLGDGRASLSQEQIHWIRDAFDAAYARCSRSLHGWQQDELSDQTQEKRIVEESSADNSGMLSRLIGGGE
jgi:hypothetical protein